MIKSLLSTSVAAALILLPACGGDDEPAENGGGAGGGGAGPVENGNGGGNDLDEAAAALVGTYAVDNATSAERTEFPPNRMGAGMQTMLARLESEITLAGDSTFESWRMTGARFEVKGTWKVVGTELQLHHTHENGVEKVTDITMEIQDDGTLNMVQGIRADGPTMIVVYRKK